MKLTTFNPVQEAIDSYKGIQGQAARRFRTSLCWVCQKDKNRFTGESSMFGRIEKGESKPLTKFICADCVAVREARKAAKEQECR